MSAHKPLARVPVPLEVRTAVLQLGTRKHVTALLGISEVTYDDVVAPGNTLVTKTLDKIREALRLATQEAS